MKTINLKQTDQTKQIKKGGKWGWIIIDSLLVYNYQNFNGNKEGIFTNIFFILSLVFAPFFYYWIKSKLIKKTKDYVVGFAVVLIFIFVAGFLGSLGDAIFLNSTSNKVAQNVIQKIDENKTWLQDLKLRWDKTQANIIDDTDLPSQYIDNIYNYRELQKLNDEKYNGLNNFYNEINSYLILHSNFDMNTIFEFNKKQHDSNDELIDAKINYFQAQLDNANFFEIEARRAIVNQKTEAATVVNNESLAVFTDLDKALAEISN